MHKVKIELKTERARAQYTSLRDALFELKRERAKELNRHITPRNIDSDEYSSPIEIDADPDAQCPPVGLAFAVKYILEDLGIEEDCTVTHSDQAQYTPPPQYTQLLSKILGFHSEMGLEETVFYNSYSNEKIPEALRDEMKNILAGRVKPKREK